MNSGTKFFWNKKVQNRPKLFYSKQKWIMNSENKKYYEQRSRTQKQ